MVPSGAAWKRRLLRCAALLVVVALPLGTFIWYKFFREVAQPAWITADPEQNFLYGSIGSENEGGLPYWIVVVLPRIFGNEYLPGPGGYASLGLPWEEGQEFPVGFSKKTVGFERVAFNCALCHATQYRTAPDQTPGVVAGGGSHTADIQGLLEFFSRSAQDPRFNAETILAEIDLAHRLSTVDRLIYKYLLIPITRKRLIEQAEDFEWAHSRPRWGPGRDAPMNLTKFNFLGLARDDSVDNTDFPAIWALQGRTQPGRTWPEDDYSTEADFSKAGIEPSRLMLMNLAGDTTSFRSVLIDSALGLQAEDSAFFRRRMADLEAWLRQLRPPPHPIPPAPEALAAREQGRQLFEAHCANCHATGRDNRMGTVVPLEEVGTDAERTRAWTRDAANAANRIVAGFGIPRTPMSKPDRVGYVAVQLDGLWLRGPYLHNGSVPTVRALLEPPACRPPRFYRGYDVIDPDHLGFVSRRCGEAAPPPAAGCAPAEVQSGCMPDDAGWRYDTSERGNGNGGHEYGTALSEVEKTALVAYLRSL
jgi:mono/diheme cytochrome c family protein